MKRYFMIFARVITYKGVKSMHVFYTETDGEHPMVNVKDVEDEIMLETTTKFAPVGNRIEITGCSEVTEEDYIKLKAKRDER